MDLQCIILQLVKSEGIWIGLSDHNYFSTSIISCALVYGVLFLTCRIREPEKHQRPSLPQAIPEASGNQKNHQILPDLAWLQIRRPPG